MSRLSEAIPTKSNWFAERIAEVREFSRDVRLELKKVTWPTRRDVVNTTFITLLAMFFFAGYLFVVDLGLTRGIDYLTQLTKKLFG